MKSEILSKKVNKGEIALFYLGQEGFLLKTEDKYILLDGYLSDYVDKNCNSPEVTWVRKYPAPIKPEELGFVDYVFCSHEHYDHADPYTLKGIAEVNEKAVFIVPAPIKKTVAGYGIGEERIIGAKDGEKIGLEGVTVLPVPAAHEEIHYDENGDCIEMGYKLIFPDFSLYHAGDSLVYDGLTERLGSVDIALLPVNGTNYFKLRRDIVGNMNTYEAAELAFRLSSKLTVPLHFDLYDVNGLPEEEVRGAFRYAGYDVGFHLMKAGECAVYKNTPAASDI